MGILQPGKRGREKHFIYEQFCICTSQMIIAEAVAVNCLTLVDMKRYLFEKNVANKQITLSDIIRSVLINSVR